MDLSATCDDAQRVGTRRWHLSEPADTISARDCLSPQDCALLAIGQTLQQAGYRFTTVTPASHARINARARVGTTSLRAIFGWSRPFTAADLSGSLRSLLAEGEVLETSGSQLRSTVRFSTLGEQIFLHSAFPTEQE